jgi:hypothetical protein
MAIAHQETDVVPFQMDCLSAAGKKLQTYFGMEDISGIIGNHIAMFEPSFYSLFIKKYFGSNRFVDAFGATWELKPNEDIGTVITNPLKEPTLEGYDFPDPGKVMELDGIPSFLERNNHLTFWGGVSTQRTMPYGTPEEVRAEVRERIRVMGKGGGYIIAPSHELQVDVPLENMLAFLDEVQNQSKY